MDCVPLIKTLPLFLDLVHVFCHCNQDIDFVTVTMTLGLSLKLIHGFFTVTRT